MKRISSRQNPEIIELAALKNSQERYKQQRFLAEGVRICSTLIAAKIPLLQVYATEPLLDHAEALADESLITVIPESVLQKISQTTTPSGIVCVFALPKKPTSAELASGIVLDGIADPGNMGTLIRTCVGMGKKTIIVMDGSVDPWNFKVIQASAGTIGNANVFQWSWPVLLDQKKELELVGLVPHGGQTIDQADLNKSLLVIGSEAHGMKQEHVQSCDKQISLAMPGNIESLNAAVAGSIAMYVAWAKE